MFTVLSCLEIVSYELLSYYSHQQRPSDMAQLLVAQAFTPVFSYLFRKHEERQEPRHPG